MTMKQLLPVLFALAALPACGKKSDATSSGSATEDPISSAPRSGRIDPGAMMRRPPPADPAAPAPSLPPGEHNKMDTDGDGKISDAERAAGRKARAESMRQKLDTDGDGKLTVEELAKSDNSRMLRRLGDLKSLDVNGDGEISADELDAAMGRHRNHGGVMSGSDAEPNSDAQK